jgi:hypothetical protein
MHATYKQYVQTYEYVYIYIYIIYMHADRYEVEDGRQGKSGVDHIMARTLVDWSENSRQDLLWEAVDMPSLLRLLNRFDSMQGAERNDGCGKLTCIVVLLCAGVHASRIKGHPEVAGGLSRHVDIAVVRPDFTLLIIECKCVMPGTGTVWDNLPIDAKLEANKHTPFSRVFALADTGRITGYERPFRSLATMFELLLVSIVDRFGLEEMWRFREVAPWRLYAGRNCCVNEKNVAVTGTIHDFPGRRVIDRMLK